MSVCMSFCLISVFLCVSRLSMCMCVCMYVRLGDRVNELSGVQTRRGTYVILVYSAKRK